jgi:hypothetical protein
MPQLEHEKSLSPGGMQASKSRVLTRQRKREKEKEIERERKKERERERERERDRERVRQSKVPTHGLRRATKM